MLLDLNTVHKNLTEEELQGIDREEFYLVELGIIDGLVICNKKDILRTKRIKFTAKQSDIPHIIGNRGSNIRDIIYKIRHELKIERLWVDVNAKYININEVANIYELFHYLVYLDDDEYGTFVHKGKTYVVNNTTVYNKKNKEIFLDLDDVKEDPNKYLEELNILMKARIKHKDEIGQPLMVKE